MAKYELKLPSMGESVAEATITNWLKKVGDPIEAEETIAEVATDKVDSEVPCEVSGIVAEILFKVDEVVKVGQVMAIIETEAEANAPQATAEIPTIQQTAKNLTQQIAEIKETLAAPIDFSSSERFYSPLVKNIAKKEGISLDELNHIQGTGLNNRVTKDDILGYLAHRTQAPITSTSPIFATTTSSSFVEGDERIEMSRMGKLIAEHMTMSKQTSAHVQSFTEVDVTRIWQWRNKVKKAFEAREGEKITFTPIFMEAVAKALVDFPMMNISVEGNTIIKKKHINIGMATALPDGNLIVPVIKKIGRAHV